VQQLLVPGAAIVAFLTLASGALYARDWFRHMSGSGVKL
jgi:hypothetical protein